MFSDIVVDQYTCGVPSSKLEVRACIDYVDCPYILEKSAAGSTMIRVESMPSRESFTSTPWHRGRATWTLAYRFVFFYFW